MRSSKSRFLICCLFATILLLSGCIPEANRERGGGPGGDIGNRSEQINMHGDVDGRERMYYETPLMGKGIERSGSEEGVTPDP
jgi:hypothetical protein